MVWWRSAGLPILATRLELLGRLLTEHTCGISYDHGDDRALADAVLALARNPALRTSMARHALALHREQFVAERVYDDMAAHLEEIVSSRATRAR